MIILEASDNSAPKRKGGGQGRPNTGPTKPVCIRVPLPVSEALKREGAKLGESQAEFMRRLLITYVAEKIEREEQEAA